MSQKLTPDQMVMMDVPSIALQQWDESDRGTFSRDTVPGRVQLNDLEPLVVEIQEMHSRRETLCQTIPLIPRPYQHRRRPNTAIIAYAAQRAYQRRMEREALERFLRAPAPQIAPQTDPVEEDLE